MPTTPSAAGAARHAGASVANRGFLGGGLSCNVGLAALRGGPRTSSRPATTVRGGGRVGATESTAVAERALNFDAWAPVICPARSICSNARSSGTAGAGAELGLVATPQVGCECECPKPRAEVLSVVSTQAKSRLGFSVLSGSPVSMPVAGTLTWAVAGRGRFLRASPLKDSLLVMCAD